MRFSQTLNQKRFSLVVQMDPPKGPDPASLVDTALAMRGRIDAVCFTDNPMAIMRMHPLAPCHLVAGKNMEVVLQVTARDRNRLLFQSELLAAWALDVRSILLRRGEDPSYGDHPLALPCNDLTMEKMCEVVSCFKQGKDLSGLPLEASPTFHVGVEIGLSDERAQNERTAAEVAKWADLGVDFLVLGPTFDVETLALFSKAAAPKGLKVLASVLLLKSVGMAKYLNTIPGMPKVPEETIQRIARAPLKQRACLEIGAEFLKQIEAVCQGAVIVPLGWEAKVGELLDLYGR